MAQIELGWRMSLSLSPKDWANKIWADHCCLPSLRPRGGAPVALQQSRTLHTSGMSLPCLMINPPQRGHLYFAKQGTFLFCIDRCSSQNC